MKALATTVLFSLIVASWYGKPFHGKPTASREIYDMNKLTCAHRTIALGTRLLIYCPETERFVIAKVTDRGPYWPGRDIDLSYACAQALGMVKKGLAKVIIHEIRE